MAADKKKILIVDDDENIAELISLYLTKEGYDTEEAHDGETALERFPEYRPDLIVLDLMLPGVDGYQVCQEIRAHSDVPIIMLSAKGEVFDKVHGLKLGADDYMEKPFDPTELVARVNAVLRRCRLNAARTAKQEPLDEIVEYPGLIRRSWNFCIIWRLRRIVFLRGNSSSTASGDTNTPAIRARLTYISRESAKRSTRRRTGASRRFSASATSSARSADGGAVPCAKHFT